MSNLTLIGLRIGAAAMTVGLVAGTYPSAQNTDDPRGPSVERRGGRGGPGEFGRPGGPMWLGPRLAARLNLTDAQKEQLKSIRESHREELKALSDRARAARRGVQAAATAETLDEGLIRARAAELATIESDLVVARARIYAEVFRILTPEQQAQAREAQSRMQQRQSQRGGRRSQRPPQ